MRGNKTSFFKDRIFLWAFIGVLSRQFIDKIVFQAADAGSGGPRFAASLRAYLLLFTAVVVFFLVEIYFLLVF